MGMPLVLRPKTFPMEMFQPKCQPRAKPSPQPEAWRIQDA